MSGSNNSGCSLVILVALGVFLGLVLFAVG